MFFFIYKLKLKCNNKLKKIILIIIKIIIGFCAVLVRIVDGSIRDIIGRDWKNVKNGFIPQQPTTVVWQYYTAFIFFKVNLSYHHHYPNLFSGFCGFAFNIRTLRKINYLKR